MIGLLADFTNKNQFQYATKIVDLVKSHFTNDVVVFYENICKTDRPPATAVMSIDNVQYFNGTLIHLSMSQLDNMLKVPSSIKHVYVPDYDHRFDILKLLFLSNIQIACVQQNMYHNLSRLIGNNKEIHYYDSLHKFLEDIA